MDLHLTKCFFLLAIATELIGIQAFCQNKQYFNEPPSLKNGQYLGSVLRLGYRENVDTFRVITIKFKITATGLLDTLHISDNAPANFVKLANEQLTLLNGQWIPQKQNGKPVKSKWVISRFYILGYRESTDECYKQLQQTYRDAFRREEELFLCDKKVAHPLKCLIEYVEGYDCYLCPPLLSETVR